MCSVDDPIEAATGETVIPEGGIRSFPVAQAEAAVARLAARKGVAMRMAEEEGVRAYRFARQRGWKPEAAETFALRVLLTKYRLGHEEAARLAARARELDQGREGRP